MGGRISGLRHGTRHGAQVSGCADQIGVGGSSRSGEADLDRFGEDYVGSLQDVCSRRSGEPYVGRRGYSAGRDDQIVEHKSVVVGHGADRTASRVGLTGGIVGIICVKVSIAAGVADELRRQNACVLRCQPDVDGAAESSLSHVEKP